MIYLNGKEVEFGQFPNKEINMPLADIIVGKENSIIWHYKDDSDIFKLATVKFHIDAMGGKSTLFIGYLPYSRMDRPNGDYAVTLNCISNLINSMKFTEVIIREPHSNASLEKIENSIADWWCCFRIDECIKRCNADSVFFPDAGALQRYGSSFNFEIPYAVGKKERNFLSGKIEKYSIEGDIGYNVLIVDDLCSRGGTFINAAKHLRERGAINVYLMVAHCENNVFTGDIFNHIDRIFTSREMLDDTHPRITII